MVKAKLGDWGLYKNFHLPELRTALQLLGPDRSQWPSEEPIFLIHQSKVELRYILRFFGRKGIQDPFEWVRTTEDTDYEHSIHVELLTDSTPTESSTENGDGGPPGGNSGSSIPQTFSSTSSASPVVWAGSGTVSPREYGIPSTFTRIIPDPDTYIHANRAYHLVESFCLNYMASSTDELDEPLVHRNTYHARFLDQMEEGLFLYSQENYPLAFDKIRIAFRLVEYLIKDLHPMGIAIYLLLLCKLSTQKVYDVLASLLRHTREMSVKINLGQNDLVELLQVISKSGDFLSIPILCLRAASDTLDANDKTHWKALYAKERHCDSLYYARMFGELAPRRAQLLTLQEEKYGPSARNVLWTSLNVADDHLFNNQLGLAEVRFAQVLQQAGDRGDYNCVKSRVPALEGLAKVALLKATTQLNARPGSAILLQSHESASELLLKALVYSNEAVDLAKSYFENSSRRINRLLNLRNSVQSTLNSLSG
jgi:hypothetical protein